MLQRLFEQEKIKLDKQTYVDIARNALKVHHPDSDALKYIRIDENDIYDSFLSKKEYKDLCEYSVRENPASLQYIQEDVFSKDEYFALATIAIENNSHPGKKANILQHIPKSLSKNREKFTTLATLAIKKNLAEIHFIDEDKQYYENLVRDVLKKNPFEFQDFIENPTMFEYPQDMFEYGKLAYSYVINEDEAYDFEDYIHENLIRFKKTFFFELFF